MLSKHLLILKIEREIKVKSFPTPQQKVGIEVMFTGNWLLEKVNLLLKPYGISEQQYNVLRILKGQKGDPINLCSIQERMIHKMSNTTRLVEKLRLKGLVERIICEVNRREVEISITEDGLELLKYLEPIMKANISDTMGKLTKTEAEKLSALLQKIRE